MKSSGLDVVHDSLDMFRSRFWPSDGNMSYVEAGGQVLLDANVIMAYQFGLKSVTK